MRGRREARLANIIATPALRSQWMMILLLRLETDRKAGTDESKRVPAVWVSQESRGCRAGRPGEPEPEPGQPGGHQPGL